MSRMIGFSSAAPLAAAAALGRETLEQFVALARIHSDGWGVATLADDHVTARGEPEQGTANRIHAHLPSTSVAGMLYLRFASRGAPPSPENTQPFLRDGIAFQHNGLLAPRDDALALLAPHTRTRVRGTTDSEVYFMLVLDALRTTKSVPRTTEVAHAAADAVTRLRAVFTNACLNAFLVTRDGLVVVHSAGTVEAPLAAFADRGFGDADVPSGHDDATYNVLRTRITDEGVTLISTTGIDSTGWTDLPPDSVTVLTSGEARSIAL